MTGTTPSAPSPFDPRPFAASPLYSALCPVVAAHDELLGIAAHTRGGQRAEFAFFGAVHQLLLAGYEHQLASFYPSVAGAAARPPADAGPALVDFCRTFRAELLAVIGARLVQTNHVRRAVGLRAALAAIAPHTSGPVDLIEIGSSAGLLLRFDRYGYRVRHDGSIERSHGDPTSPVRLTTDRVGPVPLHDLDALPAIASVTGVDLDPVDPADADTRAWLEALVWPEDHEQRALLSTALDLVAADPPPLITGDAVDVLPGLAETLTSGRDRVVFHCATRIHVPTDRRPAFDAAIDALSATGPLWRITIEDPPDPDPRSAGARDGVALLVDDPDGQSHVLAVVDGHLRWIEPLRNALDTGSSS